MVNIGKISLIGIISLLMTMGLWGQSSMKVYNAEMAVAFDVVDGKLIVLDEQVLFVEDGDSDASFAIDRVRSAISP